MGYVEKVAIFLSGMGLPIAIALIYKQDLAGGVFLLLICITFLIVGMVDYE